VARGGPHHLHDTGQLLGLVLAWGWRVWRRGGGVGFWGVCACAPSRALPALRVCLPFVSHQACERPCCQGHGQGALLSGSGPKRLGAFVQRMLISCEGCATRLREACQASSHLGRGGTRSAAPPGCSRTTTCRSRSRRAGPK
jgi:hypothetical protein